MESSCFFSLCMIGAAVGLALQICFSFSQNIWLDEAFSLALISHPWGEMINLAAADVHPPLYYVILKALTGTLQQILPFVPTICLCKLVSVLPFALLLFTAATKVRRTWGNYVGGLFGFSLFAAPSLISQGVEIRMYGWAMFFVTLAYLFAYDIYTKGRKRDWAFFTLAGISAAYTHYYACIAVTPSYLFLLYTAYRKGGQSLMSWLTAALVTVVTYLPWLFIFLNQARAVSENYWITLPSLQDYYHIVFQLLQDAVSIGVVCLIILLQAIAFFRNKESGHSRTCYILTGILCGGATLGVGLAASYLIKPVFVFRYMYPGLACFWLALIIGCADKGKAPLKLTFSLILTGTFLCQITSFGLSEGSHAKKHYDFMQILDSHADAVLITNDHFAQLTLATLTDRSCLCYDKQENSERFKKVFTACDHPNIADIQSFINQKSHPSYILLLSGKDKTKSLSIPLQYYVGKFFENGLFDMYFIPATENGAEH